MSFTQVARSPNIQAFVDHTKETAVSRSVILRLCFYTGTIWKTLKNTRSFSQRF